MVQQLNIYTFHFIINKMSHLNLGISEAQITAYEPAPDVSFEMALTSVVRVLGPFAVGKTTCITEVATRDPEFVPVRGFTSRPKRPYEVVLPDDKLPHRFLETAEDSAWLQGELAEGQVVHIVRHPTTGHVMGSTIDEYTAPYPIIDLSHKAVDKVPSDKPPIMLISLADEWKRWAASRSGGADFTQRLKDAHECVAWGLDQGDKIIWSLNAQGHVAQAAERIIGFTRGTREPNPASRHYGELFLQKLRGML